MKSHIITGRIQLSILYSIHKLHTLAEMRARECDTQLFFLHGSHMQQEEGVERVLGWYNLGQNIAMDIARGLHFLHGREVRSTLV